MPETAPAFNPLLFPSAFDEPRLISDASAWVQHIPFALALAGMLRPRLYVELGAHMGDSYCAVCQAMQSLGVEGKCAAVDTWEGDDHAGRYGEDVLRTLRAHHDPLYASFSRLLRTTFDAAAGQFADRSIDLLHIDGLHTYDAVRHDFETWLPKMSERGVVLFHDTQERSGDFGVWRFWEEVSAGRPHFEFHHGHGLGVLAVGAETPPAIAPMLLSRSAAHDEAVRRFYATLGVRLESLRERRKMCREIFLQQQMLNEWRIRAGQLVPAKAADPNAVLAAPLDFLAGQTKDLEAAVLDALRLRQRVGLHPPGPIALAASPSSRKK